MSNHNPYIVGALASPVIVAAGAGAVWCVSHVVVKAEEAWRFAKPFRTPTDRHQANAAAIVALTDGHVRARRRTLRRGYVFTTTGVANADAARRLGATIHAEVTSIAKEADQ